MAAVQLRESSWPAGAAGEQLPELLATDRLGSVLLCPGGGELPRVKLGRDGEPAANYDHLIKFISSQPMLAKSKFITLEHLKQVGSRNNFNVSSRQKL